MARWVILTGLTPEWYYRLDEGELMALAKAAAENPRLSF